MGKSWYYTFLGGITSCNGNPNTTEINIHQALKLFGGLPCKSDGCVHVSRGAVMYSQRASPCSCACPSNFKMVKTVEIGPGVQKLEAF